MIDHDGPSGMGFEVPMDQGEIEHFRDRVVWPAVDHLWGGDFMNGAMPGDEFSLSRKTLSPTGPQRIIMAAHCWVDYEDEDEHIVAPRVCCAHITLERMRTDMTDSLLAAAQAGGQEDLGEEEDGLVQAWQSDCFSFSTDPDDAFEKDGTFELQDEDGATCWDSCGMAPDSEESAQPMPTEELALIMTLTSEMGSILLRSEATELRLALIQVGVPTDILGNM